MTGESSAPVTPATELFPSPDEPLKVARQLEPEWMSGGAHSFRRWRGGWMRWHNSHWSETDEESVRAQLWLRMEHARYMKVGGGGVLSPAPWNPTKAKIANLLDAVASVVQLDPSVSPPCWLGYDLETCSPPLSFVSMSNGLLDVNSGALYSHSPAYFNLVASPFAWDPYAPTPTSWLAFLQSCWPSDPESILTLQQWFGYVLSGRTSLHKILLIHGAPRSGKGTIARVLSLLIGPGNVAGPTLASFGETFGLASLIGKPLGIIGDARLRGVDTQQVVERLLSISGEDVLDIDRKYRPTWTGTLPTRLMILSNDLPNFGDSSGTIVSRMVTLTMAHSWLGREDPYLLGRLLPELPGILNWALSGLASLNTAGRLWEPASSREAMLELADSVSPLTAFVRDCCEVSPALSCKPRDLYLRWRSWCLEQGRTEAMIGTVQSFGRQLRSVLPGLAVHRVMEGTAARTYLGIGLKPAYSPDGMTHDAHEAMILKFTPRSES
jgi:putative DNA primase/helicase